MYNSQDIAERIKTAANIQNTPLGTMFSEIGISNNTLHNMKTSMPKADTLAKIADFLDCSVDYLLGRDIKKGAPDSIRDAIISKIMELPDESLVRLRGYLEALAGE